VSLNGLLDGNRLIGEQLESVVVHGDGKRDGTNLSDAVRNERSDALVYEPSLEGIHDHVIPFSRLKIFNEEFVFVGQNGPLALEIKQRFEKFEFLIFPASVNDLVEFKADHFAELRRQRHPSPLP